MITVILLGKSGEELERYSRAGNEKYLCRQGPEFPLLSQLDDSSYDVFSSERAEQLVVELVAIRSELADEADIAHVDDLIGVARRAQSGRDHSVGFTPFSPPNAE